VHITLCFLLFFQGVNELRFFKPGESPVEIPGLDWWTKRAHVGGAMSEAFAWYRVCISPKLLQQGVDETKIHGRPTMNQFISVPNVDDPLKVDFLHMGAVKVLVNGTAEGVRDHVETQFKRGQFIVMFLRAWLAKNGYDPDEYIPLEGGGAKLHKLRAVMHDTCNAANASAQLIIEAKNASGVEHFGAEV